jgi:asparagine synthase (glutamine-hydrolysing)
MMLDNNNNINMYKYLKVMNALQIHRGPDGSGIWVNDNKNVGFAHNRLSIIELSEEGKQPMKDELGNWVCFNGEIYNYKDIRKELGFKFITNSDTEVILRAYQKWGRDCVTHFRGMFAFAIWDNQKQSLFCARDRLGIKPFYYTVVNHVFLFASEIKALLPFLENIETDQQGFQDYLTFQFCLEGKTLFKNVKELEPAHYININQGKLEIEKYWDVNYSYEQQNSDAYFVDKLEDLISNSIKYHTVSDVPLGGYVSGGVDSSAIAAMVSKILGGENFIGFTGKFSLGKEYDESRYAEDVAKTNGFFLHQIDIASKDFLDNIEKVIYHLDTPVAGPGSFCQYMVSGLAAKYRKVVLGGQGGDEVFGGYTRYLIAYFEQCIKCAVDDETSNPNDGITFDSIIPNLRSLKNYKPMLREFWKDGVFEPSDRRYFRLINRAPNIMGCIREDSLTDYSPYEAYLSIYNAENVKNVSYFDKMTHFDLKTLLPSLLQVEDRMSMAHGLESRVPFLDHKLVEFAATIPTNIKLKNGDLKHILKVALNNNLPQSIQNRSDKMGFPMPFNYWINHDAKDYVHDIFSSSNARNREFIDNQSVLQKIETENQFGRNIWGMLCLELWQREFHDKQMYYKNLLK